MTCKHQIPQWNQWGFYNVQVVRRAWRVQDSKHYWHKDIDHTSTQPTLHSIATSLVSTNNQDSQLQPLNILPPCKTQFERYSGTRSWTPHWHRAYHLPHPDKHRYRCLHHRPPICYRHLWAPAPLQRLRAIIATVISLNAHHVMQ